VARWAAFINRHENPDANWLTVDAGNYVDRVGNGGCSSKCQFMVTSYSGLHYDVLNLGKQEAWMGYETLESLMDTTKGTHFVSANLVDRKSKKPIAEPYVIKDYGNLRVAVLGLLNDGDFPKGNSLLDSVRLAVIPYMDAAKKYVPGLERKVDAIVVLAELGSGQIDTLAKAFPQIDLVISTGALKTGETISNSGKTRVIGTGSSGYSGHYMMMEFNPAWGDSVAYAPFQDQLTEAYEERGPWADKLAAFNAAPPPPPPTKTLTPTPGKAPAGTPGQKPNSAPPATSNKG
jgi:2',3'-cyclic-nucleotide 2'-phosphodiesterase (5'-nucleotidase family)